MAPTSDSPLFGSLLLQWAQKNGETLHLQRDKTLIEEGVSTLNLYLLIEGTGQVRTARTTDDGSTNLVDLGQIGPGQFVGEMSLIEDRLPVASVVGLAGSHWIRVSYSQLKGAMAIDNNLAASTYQVFAVKLAQQLNKQNAFINRWPSQNVEPIQKALLVLGEWSELDVTWLSREGQRFDIEAGSIFIREGKALDRLFLVLDGEADVLVNVNGSPTTVGRSRRGEILGEMSFLSGDERATATVQAIEPMKLLATDRTLIRQKLDVDLPFAERFYRSLAVLLSHRCRSQLTNRGMAAQAVALEANNATTLSNIETAAKWFKWICEGRVGH